MAEMKETKTMNFDERLAMIKSTNSHIKKLELLKQLKADVQFDISMNLQMAQLADMSNDPDMAVRVLAKLNELSNELDIITNEVIKEDHDISEYDWRKKHPVKSSTEKSKEKKAAKKDTKKTTGEHKSSKSSDDKSEAAETVEETVVEEQVA